MWRHKNQEADDTKIPRERFEESYRGDCYRNGKWYMDCICITLSQTHSHPKHFTCCLTFTHSLTHSYTDGRVSHARHQPSRQDQLGLGVLPKDTSTVGQVEPGIKPPTFQLVDNPHEPTWTTERLPPLMLTQKCSCGTLMSSTFQFLRTTTSNSSSGFFLPLVWESEVFCFRQILKIIKGNGSIRRLC